MVRTVYKSWLAAFVVSSLILGYLGVVPVTVWDQFGGGFPFYGADRATVVARVLTVVYFLFFLLMPCTRCVTRPNPFLQGRREIIETRPHAIVRRLVCISE